MKGKHINLFFNKKDYQDIQKYFHLFRLIIFGTTSILCIFAIILGYLIYIQQQEINKKTSVKKDNLQLFNSQKEQEVKLIKIANKTKDLENFMKEDAEFYPYYNLLINTLNASEELPNIETLTIEKDRNFTCALAYSSIEGLLSGFKYIETDDFLKNFSSLSLENIETSQSENEKNYKITINGKFNKINENKD